MTVGSFNEEAMAAWDFARCVRPDGSAYGTNGKCRKGTEEEKSVEKTSPKKAKNEEPKGLFTAGKDVDLFEVEKKAEKWRKEAGIEAFPGTIDWKHDRVHALTHEFLGGSDKIGKWIGQGPKSPTPAEETLVNMVHRAAALKARGDDHKLSDEDLARYFTRDIQFMTGRGNISDKDQSLYYATDKQGVSMPDTKKFIAKYRQMESTPGFEKLLDASHSAFTNAGDYML